MKFLGRVKKDTPADGWVLHQFANDWIGATHPSDPDGPHIFKPTTLKVDGPDYEQLRESHARYVADPAKERRIVGRFWDEFELRTNGTFTRRNI